VSVGLHVARRLRKQGHGALVVLSSVAADRARRANYVYGSTKAGLDAFAQGLGDALHGSGASVLVVRPGFVRTRMTAGKPEAPMTTNPQDVAEIIVKALRKGKETVYAPGPLMYVMGVMKNLPRPVFRKISEKQG
jgi:decaprenylphospho-beta-D-erythro-pentofuranosid-2-ulose 2-reductase